MLFGKAWRGRPTAQTTATAFAFRVLALPSLAARDDQERSRLQKHPQRLRLHKAGSKWPISTALKERQDKVDARIASRHDAILAATRERASCQTLRYGIEPLRRADTLRNKSNRVRRQQSRQNTYRGCPQITHAGTQRSGWQEKGRNEEEVVPGTRSLHIGRMGRWIMPNTRVWRAVLS